MAERNPYRAFWRTWGFLLGLTLVMVSVDVMELPRILLLIVLLGAMLIKAFLITSQFMDLKHEKLELAFAIGFSVLFLGTVLYALMAPDGLTIFEGLRGGR